MQNAVFSYMLLSIAYGLFVWFRDGRTLRQKPTVADFAAFAFIGLTFRLLSLGGRRLGIDARRRHPTLRPPERANDRTLGSLGIEPHQKFDSVGGLNSPFRLLVVVNTKIHKRDD